MIRNPQKRLRSGMKNNLFGWRSCLRRQIMGSDIEASDFGNAQPSEVGQRLSHPQLMQPIAREIERARPAEEYIAESFRLLGRMPKKG